MDLRYSDEQEELRALVRRSVRRITLALASGHPFQNEFALAHARLTAAAS